MLFDESLIGLDDAQQDKVLKLLLELKQDHTIVMITHDLSLVKQYATRVVEIEKGTIVRDVPTKEYFAYREEVK